MTAGTGPTAAWWARSVARARLALATLLGVSVARQELLFYAGMYAASAGIQRLVGLVLFLWLAKLLSVDDYARFGLAYAVQTGLAMVGVAGIMEAIVGRFKDHRSADQRLALFSGSNGAYLLLCGPIAVLLFVTCRALTDADRLSTPALLYALMSGALLGFSTLQSQIVRLQERHLASLAFSFAVPLSGLAGAYIAFVLQPTVSAFLLGTTAGLAAAIAILWAIGAGVFGLRGALLRARPILMGVAPFLAIAVNGWLNGYGMNYFAQWLFDETQVARLTFALMATAVMPLIAGALNQAWSPRFFRLFEEISHDAVERRNREFFRYQAIVLGLAGGALLALLPPVLRYIGGNLVEYQTMGRELMFLVASYIVLTPWWHCYNYYLVHDEGRAAMRLMLVTSVAGMALWLVLMIALGPLGIYVGFLAQMVLRMFAITTRARQKWGVRAAWGGVTTGLLLVTAGYLISLL